MRLEHLLSGAGRRFVARRFTCKQQWLFSLVLPRTLSCTARPEGSGRPPAARESYSSVGQSATLIMWRPAVQVCLGLQARVMYKPMLKPSRGGLAQLARAPALQAGGQRFESVILHYRKVRSLKYWDKQDCSINNAAESMYLCAARRFSEAPERPA